MLYKGLYKSKEEWSQLVQEWEQSGLNAYQWCKKQNLSYDAFIRKKRSLRKEKERKESKEKILSKSSFVNISKQDPKEETFLKIQFQEFEILVSPNVNQNALEKCLRAFKAIS